MKTSQLLLASSLILALGPVKADRPAMSERDATPAPAAPAEPVMMEPVETSITVQEQTGDVMEIQPGETIPVTVLGFPSRGMDMSRVKNELGEPLTISPTVGEPPITTWGYPDRKVYFEGRTVIHAVSTN